MLCNNGCDLAKKGSCTLHESFIMLNNSISKELIHNFSKIHLLSLKKIHIYWVKQ